MYNKLFNYKNFIVWIKLNNISFRVKRLLIDDIIVTDRVTCCGVYRHKGKIILLSEILNNKHRIYTMLDCYNNLTMWHILKLELNKVLKECEV